ncbi:ABC-type transport auxiliary lipoprotein family protein [Luteimonas pelagia]
MRPTRTATFAAAIATAVLLAGCGILPEKTPISIHAPAPSVQADPAWPSADWQLVVPRPTGPAMVDSTRIAVRPVPGEVQVYKGAIWSQPVPDLVHDTVVHAFEDSGRVPGVGRRGEGITGEYQLLLDVRRFDADYRGEARPAAVLEIGAKLVASRENRVVASRLFSQSVPAPATDVASVTRAFEQALGTATGEIVGWTLAEGGRHDASAAE